MDSSNKPPPILEIEDVLHTTVTSPHINSASPTPVEIDTVLHISGDTQEDRLNVKGNEQTTKDGEPSTNPLIVGPKLPLQGIDDHLQFWTTYDRVAGAYDKELLDGWNKSLDVLLIFAGLFSAINTAFIIESYRGLQADPVETTNTLLRLLITHRNDNDTLSVDELNPGIPSASSFSVNSLFFSSLSLCLTSAFGAVTAKQWLTKYNSVGATKAVHIQRRMRQRKFDGLKTWHLRFIIELLPMGLQASLLLFLAGVVNLLWTMDRRVATMQLVLSAVGIAIYFVTMLIGIFDPDSPFQTPLSKYLPAYIAKTRRRIKLIIPISRFMAEHNWPEWLPSLKEVFNGVSEHVAVQQVQSFFVEKFIAVKQSIGFSKEKSDSESAADEHEQWSSTDIVAAQSVMWLLEQAEHPGVTITALDAIPRLPPDLLRTLINEREDLLERLNGFYSSLRPPFLPGRTDEWRRSWPNRAVVAGIALRHIGKARKPPPRSIVPDRTHRESLC
ncbi:hypothetical protein FRC03_000526 [Tulasnella sp. 419]|nr:hypothetical protein FRC03_000526 [Tulasnella sp. 419]